MRLLTSLFPLPLLLVAVLLLVPTFAGGSNFHHAPTAGSPAAKTYAAASGCQIISVHGCDPDHCFEAGGRCKRPYPEGVCRQHLWNSETGTEMLTRWKYWVQHMAARATALSVACEGCGCREVKRKKSEGVEGDEEKAKKGKIRSEDRYTAKSESDRASEIQEKLRRNSFEEFIPRSGA